MKLSLLPETTRALRAATRTAPPLFSNMVLAEAFDARNRVGSFRVLPRTDGRFVVVDETRDVGQRTVSVHDVEKQAHTAMLARHLGIPQFKGAA